ncbi:MAG: hypothetical protein IPI43_27300 [Sandaracinaceae bacterium]|nr:hypothetical protein [Sandaracinaceae bacterium]
MLVLKYGLDFHEYREVIERCQEEPEVGRGPFLINQMMLAKGDRLSTVLVKGVDPEAMVTVLTCRARSSRARLTGCACPTPRRRCGRKTCATRTCPTGAH